MNNISVQRVLVVGCCLGLMVALSGCGNARRALGMAKQAPDEFAVVTRAPLTMPPDYGLRPPVPGAVRPQESTPRDQAKRILLGATAAARTNSAAPAGRLSAGESAILKRAGALDASAAIRMTVNRESTAIANAQESFLNRIIFWQEPEKPGVLVDAEKEARRLREASALGDAPNTGQLPVIKRKEKGILEGIF